MLIDIHCHVLPEVDDGARSAKSTVRMLRKAFEEEGIEGVVATPHFDGYSDKQRMDEVRKKYTAVSNWVKEHYPDKELFLGSEVYYSDGMVKGLDAGLIPTMNGTEYVLVEFPTHSEFAYIHKATQHLLYAGYIPIIAHVERYERIRKRSEIEELVQMGAYIQMNVSSIMGNHGFFEKQYVKKLLKHGLVHFVGTDAHDSKVRKPEMFACAKYLAKKLGVEKATKILDENPRRMLRGEEIYG